MAEQRSNIYEDVETLKQQVAELMKSNVDTGWLDIPLASGVLPYSEAQKPKYRKIGNEVFLKGVIKGVTEANQILATLPVEVRPESHRYFIGGSSTVNSNATFFNCQIVPTDGTIRVTTNSANTYGENTYLRLGISYTID